MLVLLKLGGSLITDKTRPYTPRPDRLDDLSLQIADALRKNPELKLVLGHGSGSFGHQAASQFGTRIGVFGQEGWHGFTEVWYQASRLNRLVVEALRKAGLPAITLSAVSMWSGHDGKVAAWNHAPLQAALANGLLPVLHGDVVFDELLGGTILSTEDLFVSIARQLLPKKILLAGLETGVWEDFPQRNRLVEEITAQSFEHLTHNLGGSTGADVTGGMRSKVTEMMDLVKEIPGLEVLIFSGEKAGNLKRALEGENPGTLLHR